MCGVYKQVPTYPSQDKHGNRSVAKMLVPSDETHDVVQRFELSIR